MGIRGSQYRKLRRIIPDREIAEYIKNGGKGSYKLKQMYGIDFDEKSQYNFSHYKYIVLAPFRISNRCCNVMKKNPVHSYEKRTGKKPMLGQLASESKLRTQKWLKDGCNAFNLEHPISNPMAFWTEQDVLLYIKEHNLPICSVYGEIVKENEVEGQIDLQDLGLFDIGQPTLKTTGCTRTGCMFCGFGCHLPETPGRFELMKKTHPKQYEWIMKPWEEGGLGYKDVIDWLNEHGNLHIRY